MPRVLEQRRCGRFCPQVIILSQGDMPPTHRNHRNGFQFEAQGDSSSPGGFSEVPGTARRAWLLRKWLGRCRCFFKEAIQVERSQVLNARPHERTWETPVLLAIRQLTRGGSHHADEYSKIDGVGNRPDVAIGKRSRYSRWMKAIRISRVALSKNARGGQVSAQQNDARRGGKADLLFQSLAARRAGPRRFVVHVP